MDHTVVPFVGLPAASAQVNAVPPHSWTSMPKCCLYQPRSATGSLALKKIPPIPATLFIEHSQVRPSWSVLRLRRLTFDMSGGRKQAQPAGGRPLDGGVRRRIG